MMTSFPCEYCNATLPVQEKTLQTCTSCHNPCWPSEVKAWSRAGMKINAIKVYRFMTNVGLKEAKDAVEEFPLKGFLFIPPSIAIPAAPPTPLTVPSPPKNDSSSLLQDIRAFLQKKELINAIKLYRERTGAGLKEAKDTVEAIRDDKPYTLHNDNASTPPPQESDVRARIIALVQQGQTIDAIKLYREKTGLGLRESKDAIDALRAGQPLSLNLISVAAEAPVQSQTPNREEEILQAIKQGNKIVAVKLYREQTGLGLKESLDAVEAIIRGEKKPPLFGTGAVTAAVAPAPPKLDPNEGFRAELLSVLQSDGFISAIRAYRDRTGVGLKEGKDFIEALEQDPKAPFPIV